MSTNNKSSFFLLAAVAIASLFASCTKEVDEGEPVIKYVRVTSPASSDSLLVGAYQGSLIAVMGENLGGAIEAWFNDQRASLTPTYITNTSLLIRVPAEIPKSITNTLKLVFSNGKILLHAFEVQISEPIIEGMANEHTIPGTIATIRGDYFYEPLTVTFPGGGVGELISVEDKIIQVRVPANATPGQIIIKTNFGETKSDFWYRDNRNIYISSDPFTGWWNASYVVSAPGPNDPPSINGNYIRVKKAIGAWAWTEVAGGPASAMGDISKNIPDEAILKPSDYNLKFEINTMKPYNGNVFKINVALLQENNNQYQWLPPYDTKGQWQTVVIPFEEIAASYGAPLTISPSGYWCRIMFHGPGDLDCDMSFDNFRVVPKIIKK